MTFDNESEPFGFDTPASADAEIRRELEALRAELRAQRRRLESRMRGMGIALTVVLAGSLMIPLASPAAAQGYGITLQQLLARVIALETKTASINASTVSQPNGQGGTVNVPTVTFTGVNVQVVNGTGDTTAANGAGNLIVGYNADFGSARDRSGSHNLVIGDFNNYTANAYGGAVIGRYNYLTSAYSSITGGEDNITRGNFSTVSGGAGNVASGTFSSVSGGLNLGQSNWGGWSAGTFSSP